MDLPLVNIFIPTYEPQSGHLKEAVESVLAQTEQHWSLLIHDDASKTDVGAMVRPFLADSRIRFHRNEKRLGIGGNWNACSSFKTQRQHNDVWTSQQNIIQTLQWDICTAPYIQYLFQDDVWAPTYLERCLYILQNNPRIGFTAANHAYKTDNGSPAGDNYAEIQGKRQQLPRTAQNGKAFLLEWAAQGLHPNIIGEPSFVMMRRKAVEKAGAFAEDLPQCLDLEYWTRLLLIADWQYIAEELGFFRVHPLAASAVNQQSGAGIFDRLLCLKRVESALTVPQKKRIVRNAMRESIDGMVERFFHRRSTGRQIAISRASMRIPIVYYPALIKGVVRYVFKQSKR